MATIDVVLDANGETTPEFNFWDTRIEGPVGGSIDGKISAALARTTNVSTSVNFSLDACPLRADGSKLQSYLGGNALGDAWHEVSNNWIGLSSSEDDDIQFNYSLFPGFTYRLRYDTNATAPIRVLIFLSSYVP